MAERLPYVQQNRTVAAGAGHDAQEWRWLNAGAAIAGVCGPTELKVGTGTGMQVTVTAGGAFVSDGAAPIAGRYHVFNDGTVAATVTASSPTQGRIDLVVAEVLDTAFGAAEDRWRIRVVPGTPAASPVAPAVPARSLLLAEVSVPAALVNVNAGHITDKRVAGGQWAQPRGAVLIVDSTNASATDRQSLGELDTLVDTTLVAVAGRRYSAQWCGMLTFSNATDGGEVNLTISGFTKQRLFQGVAAVAGNSFAVNARTQTYLGTGATWTVKVQHQRTVGSGALTVGNITPIILTIFDEGGTVT